MIDADAHPKETPRQSLTPNGLARDFGAKAEIAREGVRLLCEALESAPPGTMAVWKSFFSKWAGLAADRVPKHLAKLARGYGISNSETDGSDKLLFALQTYYALLVEAAVGRLMNNEGELLPGSPFSWYAANSTQPIHQFVERLGNQLAGYRIETSYSEADGGCDWFKRLYQDLFPRPLRHALGEYYTPDWLAAHVLDQVGYTGQAGCRLLDPACGSGTFLVMALRRLRGEGRGKRGERTGLRGGLQQNLPSPASGRGAGSEGGQQMDSDENHNQSQPALTLTLSQGERGPNSNPQSPIPAISSLSTIHHPLSTFFPIVGFDVNPLAVLTARANYLIAIADLLPSGVRAEPPVYLCDSIRGIPALPCAAEPFDFVVGNPPWIAWDNLSDEDRQATKPLWERYGLFSLSGNAARHGGGKKDLSMLMLYVAADRYLKSTGRLGMVITQTLFQTKGAGDGFRRFRLGHDGPPLGVLRVDDMTALRPFEDAANWTSTIVLQKGVATEYPVPYFVWQGERGEGPEVREQGTGNADLPSPASGRGAGGEGGLQQHTANNINQPQQALTLTLSQWERGEGREVRDQGTGDTDLPSPASGRGAGGEGGSQQHTANNINQPQHALTLTLSQRERGQKGNPQPLIPGPSFPTPVPHFARPIDAARPNSPWLVLPKKQGQNRTPASGPADYTAHLGANSGGANGVYWLEVLEVVEGGVRVRNITARGKRSVEAVEQVIEPDLLYPLLRWSDVDCFSAVPSGHILLAQDPATRNGIDETIMREQFPRTLEYLKQFRTLLESRAAYRRYQQQGPFYAMYNVGPYTTAPLKVVWRRMDRRIRAAVLEPIDDPLLGRRPVVPQETCVLVACETADEAYYLCAMLNSASVNDLAAACQVRGGKGFGTPGMLDFIPLHRFRPDDPRHTELASLGRQAHAGINDEIQQEINFLAAE